MGNSKPAFNVPHLALTALVCTFPALAADAVGPSAYPWAWWQAMPWPTFGWIFPFICFVVMAALFWLAMRRGGCARTWCGGATEHFGRGDALRRSGAGRSPSAREILDERYARGEIDGHEYAQKKAALVSPSSPTAPGAGPTGP